MKHALRFLINFGKLEKLDASISPASFFARIGQDVSRERVRLVHCKDDELVLFEDNAKHIARDLGLPDSQVLFLERGGHALRGQETIITTRILAWLSEML